MKIITVVGARPQFIKAAVISRAIIEYNNTFGKIIEEKIIHTGQHYDTNMSAIFFQEMHIPKPHYNLNICEQKHGAMTGRMIQEIEPILLEEKPDVVLVYGDTNSTLAGALAAVKLHIPIAHIEAGLRSFNMSMPEEINRIITDRISKWLFCPTQNAIANLKNEGFTDYTKGMPFVSNVGDVMYDAVLFYKQLATPSSMIQDLVESKKEFYLATLHRAENTDNPERLKSILTALDDISEKIPVIMPIHPRTKSIIHNMGLELERIKCIEPLGYFDMLTLISNSRAVFTDSGGLQKEACFFRKNCFILRDETEWIELIDNGFNRLVGADYRHIIEAEELFIPNCDDAKLNGLYGDGKAGKLIIEQLVDVYNNEYSID